MAETQALAPLTDPQLYLAGHIAVCMGEYTDADARKEAVANLLTFAFLHITDATARKDLEIAVRTAGLTVEVR